MTAGSKKIKIVRIIARLNIGGPAVHAILLSSQLPNDMFKTVLVCGKPAETEGDMSYYAREKDVSPYYIPELKREINVVQDTIAFIKIYRLLKKERPDIVHTHTAKAGFLGRTAALCYRLISGRRVLCVHTFHGHIFEGYFSNIKRRVFLEIERMLACATDAIITVSNSLKKELCALAIAPESKISVVPLGLEIEQYLSIPEAKERDSLRIGIIGRLVPIKNHRMFLEAAARLVQDEPSITLQFVVIGDGELRSELENYARQLALKNRVEFQGWQKDLTACYSALDIVALTSLNEGTPVSLIEAMASARPVVATKVGGVGDLLGEPEDMGEENGPGVQVYARGIGVTSQNPAHFAAALRYLILRPELRKKMSSRAREYAKNTFPKGRLVKDITFLYQSLLTKTRLRDG